MIKRLILFMIRRRLGVKKGELFKFDNQKSPYVYVFNYDGLYKIPEMSTNPLPWILIPSRISLMWLLDKECKIKKIEVS